jgi:hypothetical protein
MLMNSNTYPQPAPPKQKPPPEKNAHLKGHRRFNADLKDLKEECARGISQHGSKVSRD